MASNAALRSSSNPNRTAFNFYNTRTRPQFTPQLDYEARVASHALQANGGNKLGDFWGQVIYNGQKNGQAAIFLDTPERTQWFKNLLVKDIRDNGRLDGTSLLQATRESYYAATGVDIPNIYQTQLKAANFSRNTVFKEIADPMKPGGVQEIAKTQGVSTADLLWQALWGHDASVNGDISNPQTRQFLQDASTNKQGPFGDYFFINSDPSLRQATDGITNSADPAGKLNQVFLTSLEKAFKLRGGALQH